MDKFKEEEEGGCLILNFPKETKQLEILVEQLEKEKIQAEISLWGAN